MKTDNSARQRIERVWLTEEACDIETFRAEVERRTKLADYPYASSCDKNVLIYNSEELDCCLRQCRDTEGGACRNL